MTSRASSPLDQGARYWPAIPAWSPTTIPRMFEASALRHPDRPAIISVDGRVSYRELAADVHRFASALLDLGVERGAKVGLWLPNYPEWVVCNLAIATVGAITVPLNARFRERETEYILRSADVSVLITTDSFLSNHYLEMVAMLLPEMLTTEGAEIRSKRLPTLRRVITVRSRRPWALSYDDLLAGQTPELTGRLHERIDAGRVNDPVDMFWTSGSTGPPKGAVIPHTVLENIWNYSHLLNYSEADRCVVPTPLFYGTGHYWCMLAALACGGAMVLLREFTPEEVLPAVERDQATVLVGSPTTFLGYTTKFALLDVHTSSLRLAWTGGAHFPLALAQDMKRLMQIDVIGQVYGMSEIAGITTMTRPTDTLEKVTSSVGFPLPGFELRLVDAQSGHDAGDGPGELWVRSRMSFLTYYGMPADELATYLVAGGWYRTGDILERDSNGRYRFLTRLKDVLKVGGENVTASEIEEVLISHPAVRQAAVFGAPDAKRSEVPVAVVEVSAPVTEAELNDWCRARLAPFKVPRHYLFRAALPMTVTGKIARVDLKAEVLRELA